MPKAEAAPVVDDPKLKAFNEVVASVKVLEKAEQYAVLNAAARYFGMSIKLELGDAR